MQLIALASQLQPPTRKQMEFASKTDELLWTSSVDVRSRDGNHVDSAVG